MRLKEVAQVTFLAALPIFALELIAHYRVYKRKLRAAEDLRKRTTKQTETQENIDSDDDVSLVASSSAGESDADNNENTGPVTTDTNNNKVNEALFFPPDSKRPPCKDHLLNSDCQKRACTESHEEDSSIGSLARYIMLARESIDMCQYSVTNQFLTEAILRRHKLGVKVRVITDHQGANILSSQLEEFYKAGVQIRPHRGNGLMHNKFLVIDNVIVATGSFNFTNQAMMENYENIVVTDHSDIVGRYVQNFSKLWQSFDPQKRLHNTNKNKKMMRSAEI